MNIKERLQNVFRDVFDDDELDIFDEMSANDVEDWDSLSHINLILDIEQEFSIKFTTEEMVKAKNVGEFIEIIKNKL